jgi:hypothetical protein
MRKCNTFYVIFSANFRCVICYKGKLFIAVYLCLIKHAMLAYVSTTFAIRYG